MQVVFQMGYNWPSKQTKVGNDLGPIGFLIPAEIPAEVQDCSYIRSKSWMFRLPLNPNRIDFCEKKKIKNYKFWTISKIKCEKLSSTK